MAKVQSKLQQYYLKNPDAHPLSEQKQTMKKISEEIINRPKKQVVMEILQVFCREQGWSSNFTPILYYSKLSTFMLSDPQFQYYAYNLIMAVLGKLLLTSFDSEYRQRTDTLHVQHPLAQRHRSHHFIRNGRPA